MQKLQRTIIRRSGDTILSWIQQMANSKLASSVAYREQHVQYDVQNPQDGQNGAEERTNQLEPRHEWIVVFPAVAHQGATQRPSNKVTSMSRRRCFISDLG